MGRGRHAEYAFNTAHCVSIFAQSGNIPELIKDRNATRTKINECYDNMRKMKSEFKIELDKWYSNERIVREEQRADQQKNYLRKKEEDAKYYADLARPSPFLY